MFEVLSQKTIVLAPLAFIVYILAAIVLGWVLYGLRGYKHWVKKFNRYHSYLPYKTVMPRNHAYIEYPPELTRYYQSYPYPDPRYRQAQQGYGTPFYYPPIQEVSHQTIPQKNESAQATQIPYSPGKDDLKIVEGIGPKIEEILNSNGIHTWGELAQTTPEILGHILDRAGKQFNIHNPESWPYQASLAHQGRWQELEQYQDHIYKGQER